MTQLTLSMVFVVDSKTNYFKNKLSAYNGQELHGKVIATILRGQLICHHGLFLNKLPSGNFVLTSSSSHSSKY